MLVNLSHHMEGWEPGGGEGSGSGKGGGEGVKRKDGKKTRQRSRRRRRGSCLVSLIVGHPLPLESRCLKNVSSGGGPWSFPAKALVLRRLRYRVVGFKDPILFVAGESSSVHECKSFN